MVIHGCIMLLFRLTSSSARFFTRATGRAAVLFQSHLPLLLSFIVPAMAMRLMGGRNQWLAGDADHHCRYATGRSSWASFWRAWPCWRPWWGLTLFYAVTVIAVGPLDRGRAIGGTWAFLLGGRGLHGNWRGGVDPPRAIRSSRSSSASPSRFRFTCSTAGAFHA